MRYPFAFDRVCEFTLLLVLVPGARSGISAGEYGCSITGLMPGRTHSYSSAGYTTNIDRRRSSWVAALVFKSLGPLWSGTVGAQHVISLPDPPRFAPVRKCTSSEQNGSTSIYSGGADKSYEVVDADLTYAHAVVARNLRAKLGNTAYYTGGLQQPSSGTIRRKYRSATYLRCTRRLPLRR